MRFNSDSEFVLHELFFRLQVRLRPLHDYAFKLFHNGMLLRDGEARALVKLEAKSIVVGVLATEPQVLLARVMAVLLRLLPGGNASAHLHMQLTALCPR